MQPTQLIDSLHAIRRRVKTLGVTYGFGIVASTLAGAVVVAGGVDYLLNLPSLPRVVLILALLAGVGYFFWKYALSPALSNLSISDVAGRLERAFPEFDDRLRSTVDFLQQDIPGSDVMKQRTVAEATAIASRVDLRKAILSKPVWLSVSGAVAAIFVVVGILAVMPAEYRNAAVARLTNPFGNSAWPKRVIIQTVGDMPTRVAVGQRIDVRMRLAKGDKASQKATVYYQYDDGPVQQPEYMTRGADGTYSASLDARVAPEKASGTMKVWIKSGDDEAQIAPITVVPRLAIKSVRASVLPPPYVADRKPVVVDMASIPAVVGVGSDVLLEVAFNKPLAQGSSIEVKPAEEKGKAPEFAWSVNGTDGMIAVGKLVARDSARFRLTAKDADGFTNPGLEEYEIVVRPDGLPLVQIENPRKSEERTPQAVVPLKGLAEDDYGIDTLTLVVDRLGDRKMHAEVPLVAKGEAQGGSTWTHADSTGETIRFRSEYGWDLSKLDNGGLKPGDILEYSLRVTDNFNLDGKKHDPVFSGKLRLTIISQQDLASRVIDDLRLAKQQIGEVKKSQGRTREETVNLKSDTEKKPDFDPADRAAAERLTNEQSSAASQAKQIAGKMDEIQSKLDENKSPNQDLKDIARDVKSDLERAAENPMKEATGELNKAQSQSKPPEARNDSLDRATAAQSKAAEDLQRAMDRMENIGSLQQTIDQVAQLLKDQKDVSKNTADAGKDNLGKSPDQMKPEDRDKLEKAAKDQADLAARTDKAVAAMGKMAEQMQKGDPETSAAMSKAANTATQQQVSSKQQQASQQAQENKQADAQSAQKQAELGLQMMLNDLEEAQQRKLAELQKKLADLQKQVAILVRRQAGHNLNNLSLQGADRLAKAGKDFIAELAKKAMVDPAKLPDAPDARGQTASQEQTEQNTRDIAKAAEALPNGSEPSADLIRAAGKMERAIFALRDAKLPDAYEPPQVEALAALEAAQKIIDQQKADVDQQIEDKNKEAIRQKYVKIKEDQEKLNADTERLDKSRDAQGNLARKDAVRLGQLPGEQGKLADRVAAMDKDLASLGSIVYVWANKDINSAMSGVKDDLAKPTTAEPTRAEQARVVEQLDAMIKDLAIKPREGKFASEGGGGGGGGGGGQAKPRLPSEAELKLLKDLQVAINKGTETQSKLPAKDDQKLLNLGTRQGELRNLLDKLLQQASQGQAKLDPEPDPSKLLPEEAKGDDVENQELDQQLLNSKPPEGAGDEQVDHAKLVGDRMARSRQRLAIKNDPGAVTQNIQKKIVGDLEDLIEQARKQQQQQRSGSQKGDPQQGDQPGDSQAQGDNQGNKPGSKPGDKQANSSNGGNTPASRDNPGGSAGPADLSKEIKESLAEWGAVTPRIREAQIEGASEKVIEEYKQLVDDYYKSLATKANEH